MRRQPGIPLHLVTNFIGRLLTLWSLASKITIPAVKINGICATPSFSDEDSIKPFSCVSAMEEPDIIASCDVDVTEDDVSFLESLASEDILSPVLADETDLGDFLLDLF